MKIYLIAKILIAFTAHLIQLTDVLVQLISVIKNLN
jgi:hypothetical protein